MTFSFSFLVKPIVSIVSFCTSRFFNPTPNLNGSWVYIQNTVQSDWKPYLNMQLNYLTLLSINNGVISGRSEQILEITDVDGTKKTKEYVGKNRSTASYNGHIKRKLSGAIDVVINIDEQGHGRLFSTQHILTLINENLMEGHFTSTAANQAGSCKWIKRSS